MTQSNLPWFAIRVKSQCEKMVSDSLRYKGYEEFLPLYRLRRAWSDRTKVSLVPLFTGYLFCRFDIADRNTVLKTPGVSLIVGSGKVPLAVDPDELANIRLSVNCGQKIEPWYGLEIGNTVRIEDGPLSGIEGTLLRFKGSSHLILGIQLLQRYVAVEVDERWVSRGITRGCLIDIRRRPYGVVIQKKLRFQQSQLSHRLEPQQSVIRLICNYWPPYLLP